MFDLDPFFYITETDRDWQGCRRMPLLPAQWAVAVVLSLISICRAYTSTLSHSAAATPLYDVIPACARCCVDDFVKSEYPRGSCSDTWDVNCLCRTNTTSGFTLGEATLRCAISFCPWDVASYSSVFDICNSVVGALPKTHATITATIVATTSVAVTRTYTSTSTSKRTVCPIKTNSNSSTTSVASTTRVSSSRPPPTTFMAVTKTTSSAVNLASTFQPSASASPTESHSSLSMPAVIGVSVASGISAAFIIGVIVFFCVRKLRRKYAGAVDRYSFEIGGKMAEPPDFVPPPSKKPTSGTGQNFGGGSNNQGPTQLGSPFKLTTRGPLAVVTNPASGSMATKKDTGLATSPDTEHGFPESPSSQRTLSRLLPEKPTYTLDSGPPRPSQDSRRVSGETLFEEDIERPRDILGPSSGVIGFPAAAAVNDSHTGLVSSHQNSNQRPTIGLPSDPRAMKFANQSRQNGLPDRSSEQPTKPAYQAPRQAARPPDGPAVSKSTKQQFLQPGPSNSGVALSNYRSQFSESASNDRRKNLGQESSRGRARRSLFSPRNSNRCSECSDTSFETISIDEDDDSSDRNPSGPRRLSPVKEATRPSGAMQEEERTLPYPTGSYAVKYPKMPNAVSVTRHAETAPMPRAANIYRDKSPQRRLLQPTAGPAPYPRDSRPTTPLRNLTPQEQTTTVKMPRPHPDSPRSLSASPAGSLLAKRRGESVANKMENDLNISKGVNSKPRWRIVEEFESGAGASQNQQGHMAATRSSPDSTGNREKRKSLWERKLTPSRRGADLILSVE